MELTKQLNGPGNYRELGETGPSTDPTLVQDGTKSPFTEGREIFPGL